MSDIDLTTVIEDAISDSTLPDMPEPEVQETASEDVSTPEYADTSVEASEAPVSDEAVGEGAESSSFEVASPGARQTPAEAAQDFDKKLGMVPTTNGRENRLPYSRVKKIVERAEQEAAKPHMAKLAELEPKIQEYEQQLQNVAQFEHIMLNEPPKFFEMLSQIPAYQGFFQAVQALQERVASSAQSTEQVVDNDPMPPPDDVQPDGSAVYSMDGLAKLMDWQSRQVEARVAARYRPIEEEWQQQQHLAQIIPQVEQQIVEARTWPLFTQNEEAITQVLAANPTATLEAAYRHVVFPQLQANRDQMRASILKEINGAPRSTSAPTSQARPAPQAPTGPRTLEEVIRDQVRNSFSR